MNMAFIEDVLESLPVSELFQTEESIFDFETDEPLGNIDAMQYFLEMYHVPEPMIELNDGTQVILKHPLYWFRLLLDASGRGDFFHHRVEKTMELTNVIKE